jgi:hypothetical protein
VQNRVAKALRMAATTLLNTRSYLGGRYRHLRKQLPSHAAAVKAMARYLAVLVYRMLTHGEAWVDRGTTRFEQRCSELELTTLNVKARARVFQLVPITEATWRSSRDRVPGPEERDQYQRRRVLKNTRYQSRPAFQLLKNTTHEHPPSSIK